jgi:hypothetical protein
MSPDQLPAPGYLKVRMNRKTIYLEGTSTRQVVIAGTSLTLLTGIQCDREGDPVFGKKGAEIRHIIQLGDHIKVTPQVWNKTYGNLEDEK